MVGECVRFLFTSCEGSLNGRVSLAIVHEWVIKSYKGINHEVICLLYEYKDESIEIRIYMTLTKSQKQTHKQNIKMEFLTIYCFVFLLKMKPWGSFQVNEATDVVFMILGGCFISEIVLNLSFRWVKKILVKSDSMFTLACEQMLHVRVSQTKRWTINFH